MGGIKQRVGVILEQEVTENSDRKQSNPSHDADGFGGEEARVAHFIVHDAVENLLLVVTWERRLKETQYYYIPLRWRYYSCAISASVSVINTTLPIKPIASRSKEDVIHLFLPDFFPHQRLIYFLSLLNKINIFQSSYHQLFTPPFTIKTSRSP